MTSSYLTRPKIPLTAALSQMLENIEAGLADDKLDAIQEKRLRWRAELIRGLLTPRPITRCRERGPDQTAAKRRTSS
jgi:hypothetical protein